MPERLFLFLQFEFPWELGPPDGRYLLRSRAGAEPERVVVLGTLGAARRPERSWRRQMLTRHRRGVELQAGSVQPAPVPTARATIVDPVPLAAERQARAWLADLDAEREADAAVAVLNRVLQFHRIASADPYIHEVSPAQALVVRAGWGEGEQVADGLWRHARELPWLEGRRTPSGRRRRVSRSAALRPQERLAELLGARGAALLCEELALRARLDLDQDRVAHAALELEAGYAAALGELRGERREDLAIRIDELEELQQGVAAQAAAALAATAPRAARAGTAEAAGTAETARTADREGAIDTDREGAIDREGAANATGLAGESQRAPAPGAGPPTPPSDTAAAEAALDPDVLRYALERLEAALRARTAPGFRLR
jgi:hypothetical protein